MDHGVDILISVLYVVVLITICVNNFAKEHQSVLTLTGSQFHLKMISVIQTQWYFNLLNNYNVH